MGDATARFFDAMSASYDELEPWYEHLYLELHRILRSALRPAPPDALALDAGCGTGFQTAILAELGYRPHGLDLSAASLAVARARLPGSRFVRSDLGALPFGYGLRPAEAWALVAGPWRTGVWVDYPGYPRLRLFTDRELGAMIESSGLRVEQAWGIHAITNLMPSPVLHRPRLPAALRPLYRALRSADAQIGSSRAMRAIAP